MDDIAIVRKWSDRYHFLASFYRAGYQNYEVYCRHLNAVIDDLRTENVRLECELENLHAKHLRALYGDKYSGRQSGDHSIHEAPFKA